MAQKLKDCGTPPFTSESEEKKSYLKNAIWFCSISRNAFVVVATTILAYVLSLSDLQPFTLTRKLINIPDQNQNMFCSPSPSGDVPSGLPNLSVPITSYANGNITLDFISLVQELQLGIVMVPLVSILGNVAVAKSFGKVKLKRLLLLFWLTARFSANGKVVDATQEMFAVGICNLVGSFVNSIPVNASFSRAAVSNASGSKTPFCSVYTSKTNQPKVSN